MTDEMDLSPSLKYRLGKPNKTLDRCDPPPRVPNWPLRQSRGRDQATSFRSSFHHAPLEQNHIRLLEILPFSKAREVHCKLHHFRLGEQPPYAALSYQWGTGSVTNEIIIDSDVYRINANAARALRQIQKDSQLPYIWIDSVCIDQTNNSEKSEQVALMGNIYAQATKTMIWLGSDGLTLCDAFEALQQFASLEHPSDLDIGSACDSIEPLLANGYWMRLWIIQEVTLSRSLELACGDCRLPWSHLETFIQRHRPYVLFSLGWRFDTTDTCLRAWDSIHGMILLRQTFDFSGEELTATRPTQMPLHMLLYDHRHARCKDPRDKVFGLLSIYEHRRKRTMSVFRPDYAASTADVVVLTAAHILQESPELEALSVLGFLASLLAFDANLASRMLSTLSVQRHDRNRFQLRLTNDTRLQLPCFCVHTVEVGSGYNPYRKPPFQGEVGKAAYASWIQFWSRPVLTYMPIQQHISVPDPFDLTYMSIASQYVLGSDRMNHVIIDEHTHNDDILCRPLNAQAEPVHGGQTLVLRMDSTGQYRLIGFTDLAPHHPSFKHHSSRGFVVPLDPLAAISAALRSCKSKSVDVMPPYRGYQSSLGKSFPEWPYAREFDVFLAQTMA